MDCSSALPVLSVMRDCITWSRTTLLSISSCRADLANQYLKPLGHTSLKVFVSCLENEQTTIYRSSRVKLWKMVMSIVGLEPTAIRLKARCSNQLSYIPIWYTTLLYCVYLSWIKEIQEITHYVHHIIILLKKWWCGASDVWNNKWEHYQVLYNSSIDWHLKFLI